MHTRWSYIASRMPAASPDMPAPMMRTSYMRDERRETSSEREFRLGPRNSSLAPPRSRLLHVAHQRFQILHRAGHRGELYIIVLGNLNAVSLPQFHNDV